MKHSFFNPPTYVYIIENVDLGLFYIGKHAGIWGDPDDRYMGSSAYLNAVRAEFKEYTFTKSLIEQFDTDTEATELETQLILELHETHPNGLLNRSPNDGKNQWLHEGYGTITDPALKKRLDAARKVVRPGTIKDGDFKCLVIMKTANGKAHAPMMPTSDRTPFRNSKYWSPEMLNAFDDAPVGGLHFFCKVHVSGWNAKRNKPYENYEPLLFVETFASEDAARAAGSYYSKLGNEEYLEIVTQLMETHK